MFQFQRGALSQEEGEGGGEEEVQSATTQEGEGAGGARIMQTMNRTGQY